MKYSLSPILLILPFLIGSCGDSTKNAEEAVAKKWYKGNLHTHSFWSDGDEFPETILDWYKSNDYQFIALSDHNTISMEEKWIQVREDSIYQNSFKSYLETYGEDWVNYKTDSGKVHVKLKTYTEYRDLFEKPGEFLVVHSEEITDRYEDKHVHMNATNIQEKIEPQGGNSISEVMQNNLDAVLKQRKETGIPIMPHINHPNFYYSISLQDMISLKGERFFEVYNGHPTVHNMGDSTHISTEEMWDQINISYIAAKKPLMYGLATDDSHNYHKMGNKWSNSGRGWVMVQSDTLSAPALIEAMEKGDFYSSTGVSLKNLDYDKKNVKVEVEPEAGVNYTITFLGCLKGETEVKELKVVEGTTADFEIKDDILFVRSKITSSKLQENPIEDIKYESAWTQPLLND
ncbi:MULTISPECIES: PHP domain-containing protein [unclassified Arenibacter]|uniref:PHP domain-containing protein n=1 Tax=unclassified Arenibacter TaxID=2615047 RepID=UPI000E357092|nr:MULTISPECIES: histidinol-phosphatase [unclassified Arenibacter]MCM4164054.1 histidinol-phosphatase [Arenibacter sp. A80]RFT56749.1 histidinol-phosphatase [Arenibacter sp. P308M17]